MKIGICHSDIDMVRRMQKYIVCQYKKSSNVSIYLSIKLLLENFRQRTKEEWEDLLIMETDDAGREGIAAVKWLQSQNPKIQVIYVADNRELITEIFKTCPSGFLVRPISAEHLTQTLNKVEERIARQDKDYMAIFFRQHISRIRKREIVYIENKRRIVTLYGEIQDWQTYRKLDDLEKELPACFVRIHQSYLVNMNYIMAVENSCVELANGLSLPISRPRKMYVSDRFQEFCGYH